MTLNHTTTLPWGQETAPCISAYVIYTQDTAFQGTITSNYAGCCCTLLMPGLGVLLCAILAPQPSSEGSSFDSADPRGVRARLARLLTLGNASSCFYQLEGLLGSNKTDWRVLFIYLSSKGHHEQEAATRCSCPHSRIRVLMSRDPVIGQWRLKLTSQNDQCLQGHSGLC